MTQSLFGRALLWKSSLYECKHLTQIADRADDRSLNGRGRNVPKDPVLAQQWSSLSYEQHQLLPLNDSYIEFPSLSELSYVPVVFRALAVIIFMRIWNKGFKHEGKAEGNTSDAATLLRDRMVGEAFPDEIERAKFNDLLKVLCHARDSALAHTDARVNDIRYQAGFVAHDGAFNVLNKIDMKFWTVCVDKLLESVVVQMIRLEQQG